MSQTCRGLCRSGARRHVDQAKRCYWGPGNPGARFGRIRASETEEPDPGGGARQRKTQCVLLLEMKSTNRSNASPLKGTIVSPTHALRNFYLLARHGTKCKSRPPSRFCVVISFCFNKTDIERDQECRHHLHNSDRGLFGSRPSGGALTSPAIADSLASRIKRRTGSSYF